MGFSDLTGGTYAVRKLFDGLNFADGPCWLPDEQLLLVCDVVGDRMVAWREGIGSFDFRMPSQRASSNALDGEKRLVTCEQSSHRVTRREKDGSTIVLADRFDGRRLNKPRDVVVMRDGTILFTAANQALPLTLHGPDGEREICGNSVYRIDSESGVLTSFLSGFDQPMGLALSRDESLLCVADAGKRDGVGCVQGYWLHGEGQAEYCGAAVEVQPGRPGGIKTDSAGNFWVAARDGVHCYTAEGAFRGSVLLAGATNLCFGGPEGRSLFVTTPGSVHVVELQVSGAAWV